MEKENKFLVFGARPVKEALDSGKQIDRVYIKKGIDSPLVLQVAEMCQDRRIHVQEVPIEKLNRMTRANHQGIIAQMSPIEYADIEAIVDNVERSGVTPLIVLLDSITDVRNFGAIARSAECAGANALIVSLKNAAPVNGEAIKSSAGALNVIPVCRVGSIRNTIKMLADKGFQIVAANEKANTLVYDADLTKPTVLVMGSEDKGISNEVMKLCNCQVAIPIIGNVESLNVASAATVILFEAVRQRIESM